MYQSGPSKENGNHIIYFKYRKFTTGNLVNEVLEDRKGKNTEAKHK